jgi:hypothetical protein
VAEGTAIEIYYYKKQNVKENEEKENASRGLLASDSKTSYKWYHFEEEKLGDLEQI